MVDQGSARPGPEGVTISKHRFTTRRFVFSAGSDRLRNHNLKRTMCVRTGVLRLMRAHRRVWIVISPVKPEILCRRDLFEADSLFFSGQGTPAKIPRATGGLIHH